MDLTEKEFQEKARDNKSEATIIEKSTGRIVDRKTDFHDSALRWAKFKIGNGLKLKYKIYKMT